MSLVWHIVRKDLRRLAGPLALWLVLVLAHVWLLFVWEGQVEVTPAAFEGKRYFVNACGAIVTGVGFILAAWLVMEDSLVSTQAFWRTRAIAGARLLAAKALGALLMFSVLPAAVLAPVWLGCGFSLREMAHAGFEFGLFQFYFSLAAFALGSVTENSRQFLARLVAGGILLLVCLAFDWVAISLDPSPDIWRWVSPAMLVLVTPLVVTVHQFLTRRTMVSWLLGLAGFACSVGLALGLPAGDSAGQSLVADQQSASGPVLMADRLTYSSVQMYGHAWAMRLDGHAVGLEPNQFVRVDRVQTKWAGQGEPQPGPWLRGLSTDVQPAPESIRAAAGLGGTTGTTQWAAVGMENTGTLTLAGKKSWRLQGTAQATILQGEVLGEIPLRAGAVLRQGSTLLRIKAVRGVDDKVRVLIEERDAWVTADAGVFSHSYDPTKRRIRPAVDGFVVLNRAQAFEQLPACEEVGTVKADSIVVGRRELVLTPPEGDAWLKGAVLVKVRFHPVEKITRPLAEAIELAY